MDEQHLLEICKERPRDTREIYTPNSVYSNSDTLKKYSGLSSNYVLKAAIEHSPHFGNNDLPGDIKAPLPAVLVSNDTVRQQLSQVSNKAVFCIGPLIHYAMPHISQEEISKKKNVNGKTLMVFPTHKTRKGGLFYDFNTVLEELNVFKKDFNKIIVCLYWKDVMVGDYKYYMDAGFECVSAGNEHDPLFRARLKTFLELCDASIVYGFTGALGYSVYLNKPTIYRNIDFQLCSKNKKYIEDAKQLLNYSGFLEYLKRMEKLFIDFTPINNEQTQFIDRLWGNNHVKSPKELKTILMIAEDMYMTQKTFKLGGFPTIRAQKQLYENYGCEHKSKVLNSIISDYQRNSESIFQETTIPHVTIKRKAILKVKKIIPKRIWNSLRGIKNKLIGNGRKKEQIKVDYKLK